MWENIVDDLKQYESDEEGFGCILAHAMGLGKTLQVITFVEAFLRATPATTALIVVPVNTVSTWNSEFCKWCVTLTSRCLGKRTNGAFICSFLRLRDFTLLVFSLTPVGACSNRLSHTQRPLLHTVRNIKRKEDRLKILTKWRKDVRTIHCPNGPVVYLF